MSQRIRTVTKIGKGRYYTSSYKVSEYLFLNILYWIFVLPYYLFIKYCLIYPIKWIYIKISDLIKAKKKS